MSYKEDNDIGEMAVQFLLREVARESGIAGESFNGTAADLERGVDYKLSINGQLIEGSHRHVRNKYRYFLCIRSWRPSGAATDLQKLEEKNDNHLFSFSWGHIDSGMPIIFITAKTLKRVIAEHPEVEEEELFAPATERFLKIPIELLSKEEVGTTDYLVPLISA